MKHRVLAFICVLALLVGLLPAGAATVASAQTNTESTTYDVGYASKNLNPWVPSDFDVSTDVGTAEFLTDPENTADKKIYPSLFSQTGNQIDWDSVVTQLHDDNGDGNVDHGDGIFATCTAVTYGKGTAEEKTVLFITTDTMKAWTALVKAVRNKITESDWGKELGIQADQIMVSSNHTHSGPLLDGSVTSYIDTSVFDTPEKQTALKTDRTNYYNWVVDRIVAAAQESVTDRAPATMSKGAVNATEATAALNYNGGSGYHMNAIRHYERTLTSSILWWSGEVSSIYANTAVPSHEKLVAQLKEYNHDAKNIFNLQSNYTTSWSTTDDADNNMYVLRFEFEDSTKEPVVFVNWRAHSTMNSGILDHSVLSGDYATGLRKTLADEGYRAAFFLGAAGNVVAAPSSNVYTVDGALVKDKLDWLYEATNKNDASLTLSDTTKTFVYGRMLAEIAQYCMEKTDASGNSYMVDTPVGEIATYNTSWKAEKNKYSDALLNAAIALRAEVMSAEGWDQATFESNYKEYLNTNSSTYFPYYYKPNGTTEAILNSRLHFNTVYTQAKTVIDNGKAVADYTDAVELNAIMLGENVAFITSPNELADYYHDFTDDIVSHTTAEKEAHNDWYKLINEETYGTPFLLGYSNQNSGYIAGWLDHQANSQTHSTITGLGADGYMLYSPGTYESMTSSFAAGQGEALIDVYAKMLEVVAGEYDKEATCQHCSPDEKVIWKPLFAENASDTTYTTGHYYLVENFPIEYSVQRNVTDGNKVCIDLNGNTIETGYNATTSARFFTVTKGATLSVFDSVGTGKVISHAANNNPSGGVLSIGSGDAAATVNIYGGTWSFKNNTDNTQGGTGIGGVASVFGKSVLNVYGGTIEGADLVKSNYTFTYNGSGAAVYLYAGAELNVSGNAKITAGTVPETGFGPCVFMAGANSQVTVSDNAQVEDIFYRFNSSTALNISGTYTGTTNLSFHSSISLDQDMDIGNAANSADISGATITFTNTTKPWKAVVSGSNLLLDGYAADTVAAIGSTEYSSLQAAVDAYDGTIIKMIRDEAKAVDVTLKDAYVDLNGFNITGAVTANSGYTLYCKDSKTDDYTVSDGKYGKITSVSGNVKGIPEASSMADDGYLMVEEGDGTSFHRVNLDLTAMTLRVNETDGVVDPSVYYKSNFMGDEKVAARVAKYGVALSVKEMPNASNLDEKCEYSGYTTFKSGSAGNSGNGTLLKGIMKPTNAALINNRNAKMDVYGRAYILTRNGEYLFGGGHQRSLKDQTEGADGQWSNMSDTQKQSVVNMYNAYTSVMKNWTMPNLLTAMGPTQDGALKVLVIGNSHGLDATNLLYEVFKDQGYTEQDLVLGALYYSGCNMTQHADFMTNSKAVYDYYENDGSNADGSWNITESTVADTALNAHQWDIIILQQMNHRAAVDNTGSYMYNAADFNTVINYVKGHQIGMPKFGWHMVWTNPDGEEYLDPASDLSHPTTTNTNWVDNHIAWFPSATDNTVYDQSVMYDKIVACTQKYIENDTAFLGSDVFDFVIPSATAVEYAQDVLGLTQAQVYRDYTHMNDYGRLIAAYIWYAKIMELDQIPAVGIDAIPGVLHHSKSKYPTADSGYAVTDDMKKLIRNAVNYALDNPYELPSEEDNTVSILGIGNSYTIDSMWMLGEVYQAENPGKTVKLGIAYRSGETLSGHVTNISAGNTYHYFYWDSASDKWTVAAGQTLGQIINAQDWEMVSMQQGSSASGRVATMNSDIDTIQTYVEEQLGYVPTYLWNATWAYPEEDIQGDAYDFDPDTDAAYPPNYNSFNTYYGCSQATMYKMIMQVVEEKVLPNAAFEYLMPVGTAVQNANGTLTDHELYRDYTHLSDFSRLMAAYTWYSELELTVLDDFQLKALPTVNCSSTSWYNGSARDLTSDELALAIQSVKDAMLDNFTTTDASVYAS